MKTFDHIAQIDKRTNLSRKEFLSKYVGQSLPVVVCDRPKWAAFEKFTPEFFKANFGHMSKTVGGKEYTLNEILDLCQASTPEKMAPYPNIFSLKYDLVGLLPDVKPDLHYGRRNRLNGAWLPSIFKRHISQHDLFFGGNGCTFPIVHIDQMFVHTQLTQIAGTKEFILYAPDQTKYMYVNPNNKRNSLVTDIYNPDLEKFPDFRHAKSLRVKVDAGETIFIPSGWWHTTYGHSFNITISLDHVNSKNWDVFMECNYDNIRINYPRLAWTVRMYKSLMGGFLNTKEALLN